MTTTVACMWGLAALGLLVVELLRRRQAVNRGLQNLREAYDAVVQRNGQLTTAADEMSRLYRQQLVTSRRRAGQLKKILEIATTLNASHELDKVLHEIVRAVADTAGFRVVLLRVLNEVTVTYEARAFVGVDRDRMQQLESRAVSRAELGGWLRDEYRVSRSYFIRGENPVTTSDDHSTNGVVGSQRANKWHPSDVLIVPLYTKTGLILGYLSVDEPADGRRPSRETVELLEILAAHAVVALDNASLVERLTANMSELEEATEKSEQLSELKSSFVATISHELRTPLTAIISYSEALRDHVGSTNVAMQNDFLKVIHEQSVKLKRLIDAILDLSQLESGRYRMRRDPFQVGPLLKEVADELGPAAAKKGIVLEIQEVPREVILEADRDLVRRVLLNLGENAVTFTPPGGRVTMHAGRVGRHVSVDVEDSGIGIPKGEQEKIFEKFYQVDGSLSREYPGAGLGLAIARSIVEWHGGEINVTSEPARGARFTVRFPATPAEHQVITRSAGTASRSVSDHLTRLTVEMIAEIMNARMASFMLVDEEREDLFIQAARGLREEVVCGTRVKMGESIAGWVAQHGAPLLVTNIEEDPRFGRQNGHQYETKSLLSVPVKVDGRVVGVINVNNKISCTPFTEDDRTLLASLSDRVARVWQHASDHDASADRAEQAAHALMAIIDNARRNRLKLGSGSMSCRTVAVARRLGMSEEEQRVLAYVASIHDVGMADLSNAVASEPGQLDAKLWAEVTRHPVRSAEIVKPIEFQGHVTEIILAHHERVDGRGYPRGLKGDEIPLGARIIAVVDAYEAMISGRPYRSAMAHEEALQEIVRCAGSQFDPRVVEAFAQVVVAQSDKSLLRAGEAA